ncbi:hypothetical protein GMMP15_1700006 [Candidatus Magnetomoraceae bacterium gMMP-15]
MQDGCKIAIDKELPKIDDDIAQIMNTRKKDEIKFTILSNK